MFKLSSKLLLTLIFISTSTASIISVHDLTLTPYLNRVQLCGSGYTSAEGSSHVDDCVCDLGYYGASCDPCEAGTYKDVSGNGNCLSCPTHSTSLAGSTSVDECLCNPGYYLLNGQCEQCGPAKYKTYHGNSACSDCPAFSTSALGSTLLSQCLCSPGYTGADGGPCSACGEGKYKPTTDSQACSDCPTHATSDLASTAVTDCQCNPGYTGTITSPTDTCSGCLEGEYKPSTGSDACSSCPDQATSSAASTAVTDCECIAGYTGTITTPTDTCSQCGPNSYKPNTGPDACTNCPSNSNSISASTSISQCVCDAGWVGVDGNCQACPFHHYCHGGSHQEDCPEHSFSPQNSDSVDDCTCLSGYKEFL